LNFIAAAFDRLSAHWGRIFSAEQRLLRHVVGGLFFFIVSLTAIAQTQTGGAITSNTVWHVANSPYVVTSDIFLQSGATLTIEAGTTVYMAADTRFVVQTGVLAALGTAAAPITFTSQKLQNNQSPALGDWQQLIFNSGTGSSTKLEYVNIEYGKGVVVNGASATFNHVTIRNNQGAAVTADLAASLSGIGNAAAGNNFNAIVVPGGDVGGNVTWGVRGIPYLVLTGSVSVGASPKITAVSPNSLQQGETQTVTLTGSRLTGLSQVIFNRHGLSAQLLSGATDSQVQLQLSVSSDAETGAASLFALADAGEVRFNNALTVLNIQPKLTSVTPSVLSTNQGDATVTLKGQNFTNQSVAYLDATPLVTSYASATELSAIIPNQMNNAVKSIKLRTPNPSGGTQDFVSNDLPLSIVTPLPVATAITPADLRRGETKSFEITGTDLASTQISTSQATLAVSDFVATPTKVTFKLTATNDAVIGKQKVILVNASGSTSTNVTVNPALPTAKAAPTPLAVPPDSTTHQFAVQLSLADTVSHTFSVAVADSSVASTSTQSLTIPAGSLQAIGNITGLKNGTTSLTLTSATLGTLSLPVYVTADFVGLNTNYAPMLGVVLTPPQSQPAQQVVSPVSSNLGVVVGNFIDGVAPRAFSIGSGPTTLTISGSGLAGASSVEIKPADGVTVGSVAAAPDGKSVTVPISVAVDAPVTQRQIVVQSSTGITYPFAKPGADRVLITQPMPEIYSIDPIVGIAGTSSLDLVVRGRNLQSAQSLSVSPANGITLDSTFVVNADGTQLTARMAISADAQPGKRVITVTTPAGTSDATASAANTFTVANQVAGNVTPVASPILGIVKQETAASSGQPQTLLARPLGVTMGGVAVSISPKAKAIGETFTLTVQGAGLQGVTGLDFAPSTGLTVGTPVVAADGRSLTAQVSIAADAPQTARTVKLLAGASAVVFANPVESVFNVTAQVPSIDSIDPIVLQIGSAPVVMTIRGQNFQNAQSVRFVPPDGITVSVPPTVDANATQLTVNVSASGSATGGKRAVIVTTPGGESTSDLSAANTVWLANSTSPVGPVVAPLLGIVKQDNTASTPVSTTWGPIAAVNLGVVYGQLSASTDNRLTFSSPLAVVVGSAAMDVQPKKFAVSSSGTLTINGVGLNNASGISINPAQGVTLGSPLQVSADGKQVTVPISIASDAATTLRTVVLTDSAGKTVFGNPAGAIFGIYPDTVPQFSSISPILSTTSSTLTLTIIGQGLQNATAVVATPADGLTFDSQPVVNTDGTQLTVRVKIAPDAPLGSRVIQAVTPVTASSGDSTPANTFTVYAQ
jgi:hypothetical protein